MLIYKFAVSAPVRVFAAGSIALTLGICPIGEFWAVADQPRASDSPSHRLYTVRKNETIGDILFRLNISPLWGLHGYVRKTWLLNRDVVASEGNLIYPGTVIRLPQFLPFSSPALSLSETSSETSDFADRAPASGEATPELETSRWENGQKKSPPTPQVANPPPLDVKNEEEIAHDLRFSLGYGITTLSLQDPSTGSSAQLHSSRDLKFSAAWVQQWSRDWDTFFQFEFRSIGFQPSTNAIVSLADAAQTETHLTAGAEESLSEHFTLSQHVSYGQELFAHGVSSSLLTTDTVPVASVGMELHYQALQRGHTEAGAKVSGVFYAPSSSDSYAVRAGGGYVCGLYVERKYGEKKDSSLSLDLGYFERLQNTSIVRATESGVISGFTFAFPLFSSGGP